MTTSEPKAGERITSVRVTDDSLAVDLLDGRTIIVPLAWYPRLLHATEAQRSNFRFVGAGYAINWPDVDEHLSSQGLLAGASGRCGLESDAFESAPARPGLDEHGAQVSRLT